MIRGLHGLFYSSEPEAMRAFLRDKLQLPHTDVGEGWLIFDLPEADLGVHPVDESGKPPAGTHDISFYCDDIQGTVKGLKARGVEFQSEVADHGYGYVTYFTMPGGVVVQLYEPKYQKGASRKQAKPKSQGGSRRAAPARKSAKTGARAKKAAPAKAQAKGRGKKAPGRRGR
jgi:hypothetical protein